MINDEVKAIKARFRTMMDGEVARQMREKGVNYHLNWGATLPRLQAMAEEHGKDYDLAIALWKENVRECKLLATMMMPVERMSRDLCELWMEQTETVEVAEQAAFRLYRHLPFAGGMAFEWIAREEPLYELCGFSVLCRLFMEGREPSERGIHEFIDQTLCALASSPVSVKKAAMQAVSRFAELGIVYDRIARSALKSQNLDFL